MYYKKKQIGVNLNNEGIILPIKHEIILTFIKYKLNQINTQITLIIAKYSEYKQFFIAQL